MNPDELVKFLKYIAKYLQDLPHIEPFSTRIYLYQDCIAVSTCYDTTCSGQEGKALVIQHHITTIKEKLLIDYPSFAVEFFFYHWHLSGLDKKGLFLGNDCFLHKMAAGRFPFNNEGKKYIDLAEYFGEGKPNLWNLPNGEYLPTYIKKYGIESKNHIMPYPPGVKVPTFEECLIMDD
jgi:hypothetical protein